MKKLFYYLFCFTFILACTDDEGEDDVIEDGKVTFWIQEDFMCGPISVTIDGETRTINNYNSGGAPECGASGNANFTLPDGTYSFFASCDGMTWEGTVNSNEGSCSLMQLTPGNNPPPPSGTGKATFWTRTDLGCGPITVSVGGQSRNITAYHSSGPANCNASGAANFDLPAGTHNFSASCSGTTWQGTVTVTSDGCSFSELTADNTPPPSGDGKVTFWTSQDHGCGPITVNINGRSATINSYYSGGINGCDVSGCANFNLPAGTYSFSASCQGTNWEGTVTVSSDGCFRMQLT